MQNACWFLPSRGYRSLRARIASTSNPIPANVRVRQGDHVLAVEQRVEVDGAVRRRLLEEGIRVVPRTQLRDSATEPHGKTLVERALPARERRGGDPVGLAERVDQLLLVELVGREREREPVAMTERARSLVAQAGKRADVVGDLGTYRLGRLPGLASLRGSSL